MINFRTCTAIVALVVLTACQGNTPATDTESAALNVCPQDKTFTDTAAYGIALKDLPDVGLEFDAWHAENGERDGVKTTQSGVQYFVVQEGAKDAASPVGSQVISANYHGFFPNGDVFDSSYERGDALTYNADAFIEGWNEMLADMKVCEARTLFVPGNLAYGPQGRPGIPANATLLFHMQLLEVKP